MNTIMKNPAARDTDMLQGATIIDAVKQAGVKTILSVPDLHTANGLLMPIASDGELRLIRVCKEDECLGIAAGLSYGGHRALILIQYTGMLYALNAIRAVAVEHSKPICLMVGLLGKPPGLAPTEAKRVGVRVVEPILDLMGIPHHLIETDADTQVIAPAIVEAYENSHPVAFLIGRRPTAP